MHAKTIAVILSTVVLAGCGTAEVMSTTEDPTALRRVTVTQTPIFADSMLAISQQAGWFEDAGLEVTVVQARGTTDAVPMLLSGEVDVVFAGFSPALARALVEGAGPRAVATFMTTDPGECEEHGIVMLPEAQERFDLSDPDSLREMRIGGPFSSGFVGLWTVERLAAGAGLDLDDLDLRPVLTAEAAATLAGGGVDALVTTEPALTTLRESLGAEMVLASSELIPGLARAGLFFGPRLLADEDLAATYLAIHLRALDRYREGPTGENLDALVSSTGLERDLLSRLCWKPMSGETRRYEGVVTDAFEFARDQGLLDTVPGPDSVWDHTVRDRALALLDDWGVELRD